MPTYGYRCRECGHEFEHFEKMTSRRKTRRCPVCGERADRQISGGAGFLFKGEGFYITDYRSKEYRSQEKAEGGKDKPASAEGEPKADKPADKPTDKRADKPAAAKERGGGAKKKKS